MEITEVRIKVADNQCSQLRAFYSLTFDDAISRHQGEARGAVARFHSLGNDDKRRLYTFLGSL